MSPLDWAFLPLQRYFTFHGRSPRAEYWYFYLLQTILTLMTWMLDFVLGLGGPEAPLSTSLMLGLALLIPSLAVTVRRLHDINRSGWTVVTYAFLTVAVAIGGGVVGGLMGFGIGLLVLGVAAVTINFMIMMATDGNPGENHYGHNPYGRSYGC
jgi:uncharacterized membrane protein YhaH (DUF805 family)